MSIPDGGITPGSVNVQTSVVFLNGDADSVEAYKSAMRSSSSSVFGTFAATVDPNTISESNTTNPQAGRTHNQTQTIYLMLMIIVQCIIHSLKCMSHYCVFQQAMPLQYGPSLCCRLGVLHCRVQQWRRSCDRRQRNIICNDRDFSRISSLLIRFGGTLSEQILTRGTQFVRYFQPVDAIQEHESFAETAHEEAHLQFCADVLCDFQYSLLA